MSLFDLMTLDSDEVAVVVSTKHYADIGSTTASTKPFVFPKSKQKGFCIFILFHYYFCLTKKCEKNVQ